MILLKRLLRLLRGESGPARAKRLEKIDAQEPEMSGFAHVEWKPLGIVIARALRRNAEDRFVDATAFAAALTGALKGLRDDVFPRTQRWH